MKSVIALVAVVCLAACSTGLQERAYKNEHGTAEGGARVYC